MPQITNRHRHVSMIAIDYPDRQTAALPAASAVSGWSGFVLTPAAGVRRLSLPMDTALQCL